MVTSSIVVGVDGSDSASDAVRWAVVEALHRQLPLHIVSSALASPGSFSDGVDLRIGVVGQREVLTKAALSTAKDTALKAAHGAPLTVHTFLEHGSAAAALIRHSETATMLVLGSRGLGEFTGALLGSVGTAVAAHAVCPIVVVKGLPPADQPLLDGPIVVGVDCTSNSQPAVQWAFEEAARRSTDVIAVHAWSDADVSVIAAQTHAYPSPENLEMVEATSLATSLAGYQEEHPNVHVERIVVRDKPAREIVAAARHAQMIVTGSRGRGGFSALLLGSTSRAVLHRASVPVVVVPTGRR